MTFMLMKERTGDMISLRIALVVCVGIVCFKGININYKHTYKQQFEKMEVLQDSDEFQDVQDANDAPTLDSLVAAVQDVIGGIEDDEE